MKKIIYLLLLSLAAVACNKSDAIRYFSIETNRVNVQANETSREIWVKNSENWTLIIPAKDQEWISFEKKMTTTAADTCVIIFKVNNSVLSRSSALLLRNLDNGKEFDIDVVQEGQEQFFYFANDPLIIEAKTTTKENVLSSNVDSYTIEHKPDWISKIDVLNTSDIYKKNVTLTIDQNNSLYFRKDSIVFKVTWKDVSVTKTISFNIMQLGVGDLKSDQANLVALFNKMGGNAWRTDYRWNLSQDISTWKGVSVADVGNGAGKRVVGLQLSNVGLAGEIAAEVANITYLKALWLDNNKGITGAIPDALGELVLMENLRLGSTFLTGVLPKNLSKMVNLFSFVINNTSINGSIPNEYGDMANIVTLDLSNNKLSGELPEKVGAIKSLLNINISGNTLSGKIPASYLNNYYWPYWDIAVNICPQEGSGFTNCSL